MTTPLWLALCRTPYRAVWLVALALLLLLLAWLLGWWFFFLYLLVLAFIGLMAAVRIALAILAKLCWKMKADPKGQGSQGHPPSKGQKVPASIYKRPDPFLYSQSWLSSLGLAVTWDNPDIDLFDPDDVSASPAPVPSHELQPGKTYRVRARIWNGSPEAPAVHLLMRFHYLSFGIGAARNAIAETFVDLGVKGSTHAPAFAEVLWTTPATPGHYCLQAEIVWADDANPGNNLGQKNVDVKKLNSPNATFTFQLRNPCPVAQTLRLSADGYEIPPLLVCRPDERPARPRREPRGESPRSRHLRSAHPVPEGWVVDFLGAGEVVLRPGEARDVSVKITATEAFVQMKAININAFAEGTLVGGVTLYVHN